MLIDKSTVFLIMYVMYLHHSYSETSATVSKIRKLTTSGCVCPDDVQIYECTVVGGLGGITVWRGTAFNCEISLDSINLLHSQFVSEEGAFGNCNGGAIKGKSLRIENNRYISQLVMTVNRDMSGETIECVYDDGRITTPIGNFSIDLITVPFPPITDSTWRATDSRLTVDWSTSPAAPDCAAIHYNIEASNCGSCPTTTNHTNVTCSDVHNNSVCTFAIQNVVCGNISGDSKILELMIKFDVKSDDNIVITSKEDVLSDTTTFKLRGYQGAVAATGLLSVSLIACIAVLSLMLFKARQNHFEVTNRASTAQIQAVTSHLPISTVIDTKENIAYEHVVMPVSQ